jgi:hypothetical protein
VEPNSRVVRRREPARPVAERKPDALVELERLEDIIERGMNAFLEVGQALLTIRDGEKYRAAGYSSFEDYVEGRWDISVRQGRRLMAAAEIVTVLGADSEMSPEADQLGPIPAMPFSESQLRPLAPHRDKPEVVNAAWRDAVDSAGGKQPTARQVKEAVERVGPRRRRRPSNPPDGASWVDAVRRMVPTAVRGSDIRGADGQARPSTPAPSPATPPAAPAPRALSRPAPQDTQEPLDAPALLPLEALAQHIADCQKADSKDLLDRRVSESYRQGLLDGADWILKSLAFTLVVTSTSMNKAMQQHRTQP